VESALICIRFEDDNTLGSIFDEFEMTFTSENPYIGGVVVVASVSKNNVRVKGSPVILTPFLPTNLIVLLRKEFDNACIVFPPLISSVSNPFEYRVIRFLFTSTRDPKPWPVEIERLFEGFNAFNDVLSAITSLNAGTPQRLEGIAQYVPPFPSDVRVRKAGIISLFVV
jgi:hypothetical protein